MKVIHEEYLRAYLDGKSVDMMWSYRKDRWVRFESKGMTLENFNDKHCKFRYTPKIVEVNLNDFYAEYDSGVPMCKLIEKYLHRGGNDA